MSMNSGTHKAFAYAGIAGLVGMIALGAPAMAHHSYAMFDQGNRVEITGTVTQFDWVNPHASLLVLVPGEDGGEDVEWWIEMSSIGGMAQGGWRRDSLKPGDEVTLEIHPLKDGNPGGQFIFADLPDGRRLGQVGGSPVNTRAAGGDEEGLRQGARDDAARRFGREQGQ